MASEKLVTRKQAESEEEEDRTEREIRRVALEHLKGTFKQIEEHAELEHILFLLRLLGPWEEKLDCDDLRPNDFYLGFLNLTQEPYSDVAH